MNGGIDHTAHLRFGPGDLAVIGNALFNDFPVHLRTGRRRRCYARLQRFGNGPLDCCVGAFACPVRAGILQPAPGIVIEKLFAMPLVRALGVAFVMGAGSQQGITCILWGEVVAAF